MNTGIRISKEITPGMYACIPTMLEYFDYSSSLSIVKMQPSEQVLFQNFTGGVQMFNDTYITYTLHFRMLLLLRYQYPGSNRLAIQGKM